MQIDIRKLIIVLFDVNLVEGCLANELQVLPTLTIAVSLDNYADLNYKVKNHNNVPFI